MNPSHQRSFIYCFVQKLIFLPLIVCIAAAKFDSPFYWKYFSYYYKSYESQKLLALLQVSHKVKIVVGSKVTYLTTEEWARRTQSNILCEHCLWAVEPCKAWPAVSSVIFICSRGIHQHHSQTHSDLYRYNAASISQTSLTVEFLIASVTLNASKSYTMLK